MATIEGFRGACAAGNVDSVGAGIGRCPEWALDVRGMALAVCRGQGAVVRLLLASGMQWAPTALEWRFNEIFQERVNLDNFEGWEPCSPHLAAVRAAAQCGDVPIMCALLEQPKQFGGAPLLRQLYLEACGNGWAAVAAALVPHLHLVHQDCPHLIAMTMEAGFVKGTVQVIDAVYHSHPHNGPPVQIEYGRGSKDINENMCEAMSYLEPCTEAVFAAALQSVGAHAGAATEVLRAWLGQCTTAGAVRRAVLAAGGTQAEVPAALGQAAESTVQQCDAQCVPELHLERLPFEGVCAVLRSAARHGKRSVFSAVLRAARERDEKRVVEAAVRCAVHGRHPDMIVEVLGVWGEACFPHLASAFDDVRWMRGWRAWWANAQAVLAHPGVPRQALQARVVHLAARLACDGDKLALLIEVLRFAAAQGGPPPDVPGHKLLKRSSPCHAMLFSWDPGNAERHGAMRSHHLPGSLAAVPRGAVRDVTLRCLPGGEARACRASVAAHQWRRRREVVLRRAARPRLPR
jgi:hypothetical protein